MLDVDFRWNEWNEEHIAEHDVSPAEAEYVVRHAVSRYPTLIGNGKHRVRGQTWEGRYLQVIFVWDIENVLAYIVHARDLTDRERRSFRRRQR